MARAACSEEGCDKPSHGRGLCKQHYEAWRYRNLEPQLVIASHRTKVTPRRYV